MTLGSGCPEYPGVKCEITLANHPECTGWSKGFEGYIDWPNPDYVPSKKVRNARPLLKEVAAHVAAAPTVGPPVLSGFPAGEKRSADASGRWTEAQKAMVDAAIRTVAQRHAQGGEFTTDAIWDELAGRVPVTKGLTARLMIAVRAGVMDKTGKTAISERGGHHDHGQRLEVWYSLL